MLNCDQRSWKFYFISLCIIILTTFTTSFAGELSDFEADVTKPHKTGHDIPESETPDTSDDGDDCDGIVSCIAEILFGDILGSGLYILGSGLYQGGKNSQDRIENIHRDDKSSRRAGEALIPYARLDASYQDVSSDVTAVDTRLEVGYGAVALQFRHTAYTEEEPDDDLSASSIHLLYRMSIKNQAELDIGIGSYFLNGENETNGTTVTLPLLIHPSNSYGIELRPAWIFINDNVIQDYDASIMIGILHVSMKAGYRWHLSDNESLNGPTMGISLRW